MGLFSSDPPERALENRIDQLEREVADLRAAVARLTHGTSDAGYAPAPSGVYEPSAKVLDELAQGKKIAAIKTVREETGWGLAEAKNFVDRL